MSSEQFRQTVLESRLISIVRSKESVFEDLKKVFLGVERSGLQLIEVTLNTPDALKTISWCSSHPATKLKFGAGTVTTLEEAKAAISAGAQFLVCPILSIAVIEEGLRSNVPVIPGCMTPTEVFTAQSAGAEFIKLFPVSSLGANYLKDMLAPLSSAKLIAVGGVGLDNLAHYFEAGAVAVGIGNSLISEKLLREASEEEVLNRLEQYVKACRKI